MLASTRMPAKVFSTYSFPNTTWMRACAGMTELRTVIPAEAGMQMCSTPRIIELFSEAKCDSQSIVILY
jgi:hypothetical protein